MEDTLIGYVFDREGMYQFKYLFKNKVENVANFLVKFDKQPVTITDCFDRLILKANRGIVDQCPDQEYCMQLINVLAPLQMGYTEPKEMDFKIKNDYYLVHIEED